MKKMLRIFVCVIALTMAFCSMSVTTMAACKHKYIYTTIVRATCEQNGLKATVCKYCNKQKPNTSKKIIKALGHKKKYGSSFWDLCENDLAGAKHRLVECSRCGKDLGTIVSKKHYHKFTYDKKLREYKCTYSGCPARKNKFGTIYMP